MAHQTILAVLKSLNYRHVGGVCHGFSFRWFEATSLKEQEVFEERIEKILKLFPLSNQQVFLENMLSLKKIWVEGKNDNAIKNLNIKDVIDLISFFDSLVLFHDLGNYPELSESREYIDQHNLERSSSIASSAKIAKEGGLKKLHAFTFVFPLVIIREFVNTLSATFEETANISQKPIGFILYSENHTVALSYQIGRGWIYRDINQKPLRQQYLIDPEKVAKLIARGFEDKFFTLFNMECILTANDKRREILLEKLESPIFDKFFNANISLLSRAEIKKDINFIWLAAAQNDAKTIIKLMSLNKDLLKDYVNKRGEKGTTPLWIAAQNGAEEAIEILGLHLGANVNQTDIFGVSPLAVAALTGRINIIETLIKLGADINQQDNRGITPLGFAAKNGHDHLIEKMVSLGSNLDSLNKEGQSLVWLAAHNNEFKFIEKLSELKVDINQPDNNGVTPLWIAAQNNNIQAIETLGRLGANINTRNKNGVTPIWIAAQQGSVECILALKKLGADINQVNQIGVTPLWIATQNNHPDAVATLANLGANVDEPDEEDNMSPLWIATDHGHIHLVGKLIKFGADVNQPDKDGIVPIMIALRNGDIEILKIYMNNKKVDLDKLLKISRITLENFFEKCEKDIKNRLSSFISTQLSQQDITITVFQIAQIIGSDSLITNLNKNQNSLPKLENNTFFKPGKIEENQEAKALNLDKQGLK